VEKLEIERLRKADERRSSDIEKYGFPLDKNEEKEEIKPKKKLYEPKIKVEDLLKQKYLLEDRSKYRSLDYDTNHKLALTLNIS
jgi:hypothetical protein